MRRALIACGGTGGHLAPGIALAEELESRGWQCELLISQKQVDALLIKRYSRFEYASIPGSGFNRSPLGFARFLRDLVGGIRQCSRIIRLRRPDVVISFGGFLSASALIAGKRHRLPVALHEANRIPGKVTRLASRFADRVYLPEGVAIRAAISKSKSVGMPLRSEIVRMPRADAKDELGLDSKRPLLVVIGGSQGARSLNLWFEREREGLARRSIQTICVSGDRSADERRWTYVSSEGVSIEARAIGFCDRMALLLSAANLTVSRSGAGSIAEILRCRVPSILVPYPYAADNHQWYNAKQLSDRGAARLWMGEEIDSLTDIVLEMIGDERRLQTIENHMGELDTVDARVALADDLERFLYPALAASGKEIAQA